MGTIVQVPATQTAAPVQFVTSQDAWLASGSTSVQVPVMAATPGTIGNVAANSITQFVTSVAGISAVTNANAFANGQDQETIAQQRYRFSQFVKSRSRGTAFSMQYAATTVNVTNASTGLVTEQVRQAVAVEGSGTVTVYIWNGAGAASSTLISNVTKLLTGYIDPMIGYVYGYKPAGVTLSVLTMPTQAQNLTMHIVAATGFSFNVNPAPAGTTDITAAVSSAIAGYFATLMPGQSLIWSQLLAAVQNVAGVQEVSMTVPTADVATPNTYTLITQGTVTYN
jgi:uncharacterized phage protein gp47/JayE